jgi:20S proteasome subunit beta 2
MTRKSVLLLFLFLFCYYSSESLVPFNQNHFVQFPGESDTAALDGISKVELSDFQKVNRFSTGTTIVGLCCRDGVVLGADTRSTSQQLVMDKNKLKIRKISNKIFACGAGTSALCDFYTRKARHRLELENIGIYGVVEKQSNFVMVNSAVQYLSEMIAEGGAENVAVFIVGGMDVEGPKLFQIDTDAVPCRLGYCALGSGSVNAMAVLESAFDDLNLDTSVRVFNNISVAEGINMVRNAVSGGIMNDLGSGSHINFCVITTEEVKSWRERNIAESSSKSEKNKTFSDGITPESLVSFGKKIPIAIDHNNSFASSSSLNKSFLGKKIWSKLSSRIVWNKKHFKEEILEEYDEDQDVKIDLCRATEH